MGMGTLLASNRRGRPVARSIRNGLVAKEKGRVLDRLGGIVEGFVDQALDEIRSHVTDISPSRHSSCSVTHGLASIGLDEHSHAAAGTRAAAVLD
jgi:hypothetical protein